MISAAEREIHTGDAICFNIITKVGNRAVQTFSVVGVVLDLKQDLKLWNFSKLKSSNTTACSMNKKKLCHIKR